MLACKTDGDLSTALIAEGENLSLTETRRYESESVVKVKAHRNHSDATISEHERLLAFGNHSADEHADLAEKLHPTNSEEFKKQTEGYRANYLGCHLVRLYRYGRCPTNHMRGVTSILKN